MIRVIPIFHAARAAEPIFSGYFGRSRTIAILLRSCLWSVDIFVNDLKTYEKENGHKAVFGFMAVCKKA